MLEGVVEPRPEVKDIAEMVAEALVEDSQDDTVQIAPMTAKKPPKTQPTAKTAELVVSRVADQTTSQTANA